MTYMPIFDWKKLLGLFNKKSAYWLCFTSSHFTFLAVIIFIITGGLIIFVTSYIVRYDRYDYWHWKQRALSKILKYCLIILLLKLFLVGMAQ